MKCTLRGLESVTAVCPHTFEHLLAGGIDTALSWQCAKSQVCSVLQYKGSDLDLLLDGPMLFSDGDGTFDFARKSAGDGRIAIADRHAEPSDQM